MTTTEHPVTDGTALALDYRLTPAEPPAASTPAPHARCGRCFRAWNALGEAHCGGCCTHFSGVDSFDRHREGDVDSRVCVDPAMKRRSTGGLLFEGVTGAFGIVWRIRRERGDYPAIWKVGAVG